MAAHGRRGWCPRQLQLVRREARVGRGGGGGVSEIERDVREDIDKAEERLDAQVDIIMSKMNS